MSICVIIYVEVYFKVFSKRFKSERIRIGLTQQQIAEKLGISRSNVGNWENGSNEASNDMLIIGLTQQQIAEKQGISRSNDRNTKEFIKMNRISIENVNKVLNSIDKNVQKDLDLNSFYSFTPSQLENKSNLPKDNADILLDKLRDMKLLSNNKELSNEELQVILKFIENNKNMLKDLINKDGIISFFILECI